MSQASVTAENEFPAPQLSPPAPDTACRLGEAEATASCCRRAAKRSTAFQPSERQLQLAEILATDKDALTITSLCEKAGVTRNTFYRWQRDTQFQLWLARIAMQTLLATSPMLLMQGVNDALNGDFRAWRTMLNFAYNPRGLAALDAFLARLEENAANSDPADADERASAPGDDSTEAAATDTTQRTTTPVPAGIGSTIATTARVMRDLRRSGARQRGASTPARPNPRCGVEVSYKYTPPPPKQSQGLCADQSPATNEATASQSSAVAEPAQPATGATTASQPTSTARSAAPSEAACIASPSPQTDSSFPPAGISALIERARKLTPTEIAKAAFNGEFGMVKLALSEGADPNSRDDVYGVSALSAAAATGKIEVMRLLLRRGADVHARDNQGRTALDHARRQNQRAAIELLLEAGAH